MSTSLRLGVIGNCSVCALVTPEASVEWFCLPDPSSDPALFHLVDSGEAGRDFGMFSLEVVGAKTTRQRYKGETAILLTEIESEAGGTLEVTDLFPRFQGKTPKVLSRRVRALQKDIELRILCRPGKEYGRERCASSIQKEGIFYGEDYLLIASRNGEEIVNEQVITLAEGEEISLYFGSREEVEPWVLSESAEALSRTWEELTAEAWREWLAGLKLPAVYRENVVRAAIGLKLCHYEPSGGSVAAMTSSIPEYSGSDRTWDYRYSWFRDSFFTLDALGQLGDVESLRSYYQFAVKGLKLGEEIGRYQAMFSVELEHELQEVSLPWLSGYRGHLPVRRGNGAYIQQQNDLFGSTILIAAGIFDHPSCTDEEKRALYEEMKQYGEAAHLHFSTPDAGIWEFRTMAGIFTYSALMCWAACDRLHRFAVALKEYKEAEKFEQYATEIKKQIDSNAWNEELQAYTNAFGSRDADATLLLMPALGFIDAHDPRFLSTISFTESQLRVGDHMMRHIHADDFGVPVNSFISCTLWLIDALSRSGRLDEARRLYENLLKYSVHGGYFSEHLDISTSELWGNYPQTYALAGVVTSAIQIERAGKE